MIQSAISSVFLLAGLLSCDYPKTEDLFYPETDSFPQVEIEESKCSFNDIPLYGRVQFVDAFPDIKIQYVDAFPDVRVQFVDAFPDDCGRWQVVEAFPDFKVQIVDAFPDIRVQQVTSFPGMGN